jgi:hypothetical protein
MELWAADTVQIAMNNAYLVPALGRDNVCSE